MRQDRHGSVRDARCGLGRGAGSRVTPEKMRARGRMARSRWTRSPVARRAVGGHHPRMRRAPAFLAFLAAACTTAAPETPPAAETALGVPTLTAQASGTTVLLQGVSAANERVVWVSGRAGTFVRTTDGGERWEAGRVAGAAAGRSELLPQRRPQLGLVRHPDLVERRHHIAPGGLDGRARRTNRQAAVRVMVPASRTVALRVTLDASCVHRMSRGSRPTAPPGHRACAARRLVTG